MNFRFLSAPRYHFAQHQNENLTAAKIAIHSRWSSQHYQAIVTLEKEGHSGPFVPSSAENVVDFVA